MNRNEFLEALPLTRITLKLTGAALEICTADIDDIHVMVSGSDKDTENLRIMVNADQLVLEQPASSLAKNPINKTWLQVTLRLPQTWKGRIEARTVSGWITARCLSGADLSLDSVSGTISGSELDFITISARSVTGDVRINGMSCEKCSLASTSGDVSALTASLQHCSLSNITGDATLSLYAPFEEITATTVTGDVIIEAPMDVCSASLRSVSGRIRTSGVTIREDGPKVRVTSVTGGLDLSYPNAEEEQ